MSLRFYFGSSGSGKSWELYEEIIKRSQENPELEFLILVPDQFTMQTQKEFVLRHPDGVIRNIDVLSFGRLSHRIFEEVGYDTRPILDDTGKSLVLRKLAGNVRDDLPVLGGNLSKQSYIHEIKSAISEFMQYGIGIKELEELVVYSEQRGALCHKLKDLQKLYSEFLQYIEQKYITTEETLDLVVQALKKVSKIEKYVIAFDGFTGFTPIQNRLIQEFMALAQEVIVTITVPETENPFVVGAEQELFYLSKKTVHDLCKLAEDIGVSRGNDIYLKGNGKRFSENGQLSHLEKYLFRYPFHSYQGEEKDEIKIYEASDLREEVKQCAIQIRRFIREGGFRYRDIAVVCGNLPNYAEIVEEQFSLFEIPCFIDQTRGILLNPFIEFMKSALAIFIKDFSYESVFHYLRSGLTDFTVEEIDWFENYILRFNIHGKRQYQSAFTKKTERMEEDADSFTKVNKLRLRILESLEPLMQKMKVVSDYVERLYDFLLQSKVQEKLYQYQRKFEEKGDLTKAGEYTQIYPMVMELLDQIQSLLGKESITAKEFYDILEAGLAEIEVGMIPQNVDRVVVGDIERTRLKQVRVLFFLGVNDGNIPKGTEKGGIISDIDREFLKESSLELSPSPRQKMYIQRMYLYLNMTKPSEKLYLSYSRVDGEGKSIRPSYLIDVLKKLFPTIKVDMPQMMPLEEQLETPSEGLSLLADLLRRYAEGNQKNQELFDELFGTLYMIYSQIPEFTKRKENLKKASFYRYEHNPLAKEVAKNLYGATLENSVTRLETYASCAYEHFLKYGLSLKEQEEYTFENVDMGNIFHKALELFAEKLEESGLTWFEFSKNQGEKILQEVLESCSVEYKNTVLFSTARNTYHIERMKRILCRTVETLQMQLKKGSFVPADFELSFSRHESLDSMNIALSEQEKMHLYGRIDRVDTKETGEQIYVKVMDYKSGNKKFDLVALYYGLQLQLVVYLNAAMEAQQKKCPEKKVVPAAMLYYHVSDPVVTADYEMTPDEINEKIMSELRMTGMVNSDIDVISNIDTTIIEEESRVSTVIPVELKKDGSLSSRSSVLSEEDMEIVSNYVNKKIKEIGNEILNGNIALSPYERGKQNACTYCSYRTVCGFDSHMNGMKKRNLKEYSKDEIMERFREEE